MYSTRVEWGSESSPKIYDGSMDLEAGTYYIRISKAWEHTGTYELKAEFSPANNNEIEEHF